MGFRARKISDRVYWVGAIDWTIRDFHGYSTERGSTYNAYLILADKVTLIDTVKAPFIEEMMERIASVIEPGDIDYIISNHSEMDHSGSLPAVVDRVKPEKVFASTIGAKALKEHFHFNYEIFALKDGDELSLGDVNLKFLETRMLHWPDSMVTYLVEEKLLFTQDGFGMHLATGERFADEIDQTLLRRQAGKYYANILLPYSAAVLNLLKRIKQLGILIDIIAPDHGPIWRQDVERVLSWYQEWAEQKPQPKALIVFDTMWQSTDLMARAIADGVMSGGVKVEVMRLRVYDRSYVMAEALDSGGIIVGSPTLNNGIFPTVADMLGYMKGLKPKNKVGAAFGSYGWSGEAVNIIADELKAMGMTLPVEPLKVKYVPDEVAIKKCVELGAQLAGIIKERE
ncbi:MAG: FprA family A-type flavoprotein [bacterium]